MDDNKKSGSEQLGVEVDSLMEVDEVLNGEDLEESIPLSSSSPIPSSVCDIDADSDDKNACSVGKKLKENRAEEAISANIDDDELTELVVTKPSREYRNKRLRSSSDIVNGGTKTVSTQRRQRPVSVDSPVGISTSSLQNSKEISFVKENISVEKSQRQEQSEENLEEIVMKESLQDSVQVEKKSDIVETNKNSDNFITTETNDRTDEFVETDNIDLSKKINNIDNVESDKEKTKDNTCVVIGKEVDDNETCVGQSFIELSKDDSNANKKISEMLDEESISCKLGEKISKPVMLNNIEESPEKNPVGQVDSTLSVLEEKDEVNLSENKDLDSVTDITPEPLKDLNSVPVAQSLPANENKLANNLTEEDIYKETQTVHLPSSESPINFEEEKAPEENSSKKEEQEILLKQLKPSENKPIDRLTDIGSSSESFKPTINLKVTSDEATDNAGEKTEPKLAENTNEIVETKDVSFVESVSVQLREIVSGTEENKVQEIIPGTVKEAERCEFARIDENCVVDCLNTGNSLNSNSSPIELIKTEICNPSVTNDLGNCEVDKDVVVNGSCTLKSSTVSV